MSYRGRASRLVQAALITGLLVLGHASTSHAQLTFTLSPSSSVFAPGDTIALTGTLTLSAAVTESYDLLGTSANITGSAITGLTVDDSNFASNLPFSLAPGGTYTNSINVIAGSNASLGVYSLSYQVEGQGTTTATSASGVGTAQLTVNAANVSAPEPSSLALLIPMMGTIGIIFRRNRVGAS